MKRTLPVEQGVPRSGPTLTIGRRYTFEAAHRLPRTPAAHKCHAVHGHSYAVEVFVRGRCAADLDWIVDFGALDAAWGAVAGHLDHSYLNEIEGLQNPTSERICVWLWERLNTYWSGMPGVELARIVVAESARSSAIYEGP